MRDMAGEEQTVLIESDEENNNVNEEGIVTVNNEVNISDGSDDDVSIGSHQTSRSYTNNWPQSYRESIDVYSAVTPPTVGILHGVSSLSRFGNSLTASFQSPHTPKVITSLIEPLMRKSASKKEHQQPHEHTKSSDALLPFLAPDAKPPSKKPKVDNKPSFQNSFVSHEIPAGPQQCTYGQAVINGINVLCGVGLLSTPNAVKQGGWLGLFILLLFAVLAYFTGILLRRCLDSEPGLETYPDIGQAAFGMKGRLLVSIILYMELYAGCVEYIILESDNLSSLFPNARLQVGGLHMEAHLLFAIITTIVVLPTTWVRDLSILSYLSAGGVIATILVALSLFWIGTVDQVPFAKPEGPLLNLSGLPIALGLYGFCYSGHAVFPNIYTSLKQPNQYPSVLLMSFLFATIMFGGVGIYGYAMFGDATESQFTLNMPQDLFASKFAVWTTVVNPLTKYALTLMPMALSLEELIPKHYLKSRIYSIVIRTALVVSTLLVAISVPFFGLVMALIGSLLTMLVALILPCLCFLSIVKSRVTWFEITLCTTIIAVGVTSAIIGSYTALKQIIESLF